MQPQHLEDNLSQLEYMLAEEAVRKDEKLWTINQTNFSALKFFLGQYTEKLNNESTEYLPRQRHTLEFIIKCASLTSFSGAALNWIHIVQIHPTLTTSK